MPEHLDFYFDFFRYGAPPHGGFGMGLARVLMLHARAVESARSPTSSAARRASRRNGHKTVATASSIEGSFNFRDTGGTPLAAGGLTREGVLYRSDALSGNYCAPVEKLAATPVASSSISALRWSG